MEEELELFSFKNKRRILTGSRLVRPLVSRNTISVNSSDDSSDEECENASRRGRGRETANAKLQRLRRTMAMHNNRVRSRDESQQDSDTDDNGCVF